MPEDKNTNDLNKQSLTGHLKLIPIMLFFGMLAYGFIQLLIWISSFFEGKF